MKEMLPNMLKAGLILFAVGALLALAAPYIALAMGLSAPGMSGLAGAIAFVSHSGNPLWLGPFFGAFGAINAGVETLLGKKATKEEAPGKATSAAAPAVIIMSSAGGVQHDPSAGLGATMPHPHSALVQSALVEDSQFAAKLGQQRLAAKISPFSLHL